MMTEGKQMPKKEYLECAKVATAHGIGGVLQVECYCDSPEVLAALPAVYVREANGSYSPRRVLRAVRYKSQALLTLEGIESREEALALRGTLFYASRADIPIPEGGALIADMLGLSVIDADTGRVYGILHDVTPSPAADLYDIKTPEGAHVLLPAVPAFLDRIDIDSGIYIRPIPGFFEEV
jgi:16S rRNA processing protein RimM